MPIKILSWNIWVGGDFAQWKEFLDAADADIVGLQEVKDDDPERDVIGYLTNQGYRHVFARTEQIWDGKPFRHGPALFSKLPIARSETYLLDKKDQRAAARVDIKIGDVTFHVFSTHLIHTHQAPSSQQEAQVAELIKLLPSDHVIVMGDFNATPESAAIRAMRKILIDTDPADTPTWSVHPEGCAKCDPQAIDTRLDYIFVSKDMKTDSFRVGQSRASDHLPILVDIT